MSKTKYLQPEKGCQNKDGAGYVNCGVKEGRIVPRKGFVCDTESLIYRSDFSPYTENEFRITDCKVYANGKMGQMAVLIADNLSDSVIFNMRLIFADGSFKDVGSVTFNRVSIDQFGYPANFTFFSGRPVTGCGIFFIARQVYSGGYEDFVRVMELDGNMEEWRMLTEEHIYVPTLLANGRGEAYYMACPFGERLDLPSPIFCESKNLLGGRFKAYFTSDSASTSFFLPIKELDEERIEAEFEEDGVKTKWVIPAGRESSEEMMLDGQGFTMLCDRELGRIYFKNSDSMDYPLPYTGKMNNLCVEASKVSLQDKLKVASANACLRLEGENGVSDEGVSVFYGSFVNPNMLVMNSPVHPLYFPENYCFGLGERNLRVKKVINREHTLMAFKDNGIFVSEVPSFITEPNVATLSSGIGLSVTDFAPEFKRVAELSAPLVPETIQKAGGFIIGATIRGELVKISGRGRAGYKVTTVGRVEAAQKSFALALEEGYVCFHGKTATVVSELDAEKPFFAGWTLPCEMVGGIAENGEEILFSSIYSEGIQLTCCVGRGGSLDKRVSVEEGEVTLKAEPIFARYISAPFSKECEKVLISKISADGMGDSLCITVCGEAGIEARFRTRFLNNRASVFCGKTARHPKIILEFTEGEIKDLSVEYRKF